MRRVLWVGVGVVGTIVVLRQVSKASEKLAPLSRLTSPSGIADSIASLAVAAKELSVQFREAMAENEEALRQALLADPEAVREAKARRADKARLREDDDPFDNDDIWS